MARKKLAQLCEAPESEALSPEFAKRLKELVALFKKTEKFNDHANDVNQALLAAAAFQKPANEAEWIALRRTMISSKVDMIQAWGEHLTKRGLAAQRTLDGA